MSRVSEGHRRGRLSPEAVRDMFDRISPLYDAMNCAMTLGLDRRWRRLAADAVVRPGDRVLDVCCGTGSFALADERAGGVVTGLDFAPRMLERARRKSQSVTWVEGDALAMPFADGAFDSATFGFGIRNVLDIAAGFAELHRVLRPGGRLACLEITRPDGPLRPLFQVWCECFVPIAGRALPGGAAYTYLPASVRRFPGPTELATLLGKAGFVEIGWRTLGGGMVTLHTAATPPSATTT